VRGCMEERVLGCCRLKALFLDRAGSARLFLFFDFGLWNDIMMFRKELASVFFDLNRHVRNQIFGADFNVHGLSGVNNGTTSSISF